MYSALVEKDPGFEGIFFAAIKTTGIFCRPTCTARKPLKENVEFFQTSREAILHGYRPCRICAPLNKSGSMPDKIKIILDELNNNSFLKLNDNDLLARGVEPSMIRRWFKKYHGITFHGYQRMMRINRAFTKIKDGESVTSAAYGSGYESLSGFGDSFKTVMGSSPNNSMNKSVINITRIESVLGPLFAAATDEGICLLEFTDRKMLEIELKSLTKLFGSSILHGENNHLHNLRIQLGEYFAGERKEFELPLVMPGTDFQKKVWNELLNISYGTTRSYKQQSIAIGNRGAVRAVANANGMNRIAIIIPCHRVIGDDGHLTGYGGGIWRKKFLLDLERRYSGKITDVQLEINLI
jgi:AraC family transcriptional regulator of adaptative response/methylated-DNA-[protein]-cysteine methyltransferase